MTSRIFVSILLVLLGKSLSGLSNRTAICFLTRQPAAQTLAFAQTLAYDAAEDHLDVFIAIDNNSFDVTSLNDSSSLRFIQIPNEQCRKSGFRGAMRVNISGMPNVINSWDKSLFYFIRLDRNYSFVWLIEDDVFIPSTRALLSLHRLYSSTSDLVMNTNYLNRLGNISSWNWRHAQGRLLPPWSCSMANVIGLSRLMLNAVDEYVRWRGFVPYHEFFFNTFAVHLNATIVTPSELSTLYFRPLYAFDSVRRSPNNLFHPVKNLQLHVTWRQRSVFSQLLNQHWREHFPEHLFHFRLIKEFPDRSPKIDANGLSYLCENKQSIESTEKYLITLLARLDQVKGALSTSIRRSLRANFSALRGRCEEYNAPAPVIGLIQQLANHSHQLPGSTKLSRIIQWDMPSIVL